MVYVIKNSPYSKNGVPVNVKKGDLVYTLDNNRLIEAKCDAYLNSGGNWGDTWKSLQGKLIKDTKIARKVYHDRIIAESSGYLIIKE